MTCWATLKRLPYANDLNSRRTIGAIVDSLPNTTQNDWLNLAVKCTLLDEGICVHSQTQSGSNRHKSLLYKAAILAAQIDNGRSSKARLPKICSVAHLTTWIKGVHYLKVYFSKSNISLAAVPVLIRKPDASLDNGARTTLINSSLLPKLGVKNTNVSLMIETITGEYHKICVSFILRRIA
ncbi:hypothetical protein CSKR_105609 [Clonorchis sinensis]|uniref:Uncharacterized protein n=1 Tax=Clonorchis sinensis TaxID=79923 RepID=A0A419PNI7_CLOSI|nr:hypothetical protein CSKR_105609 [Clonorchis sinensis]